jgi:hypothetical protein
MSIQEIVNLELSRQYEESRNRQRSGCWSPSSFGNCYRKQFYNRKNEIITNPPEERNLRVFKAGVLFHKFVEDILINNSEHKNDIKTEVMIKEEDVLGFADIVNSNTVYDLKSIHSKGFWYLNKVQDIVKEKFNNWLQVMWYALKLEKQFGCLVFISKDDLTINEYIQPLDDYWKNEIDLELTRLRYYWQDSKLPPAEPKLYNGKECNYCNWKDLCYKIEGYNVMEKFAKEKKDADTRGQEELPEDK